ncbi:MAG: hypothetical protein QXV30_01755 [Desulfurococcaceae archaeon]
MSQYQTHRVRDASKLVEYVTIVGRLEPLTEEDYVKLVKLAHEFRKAATYATRMIAKGIDPNTVLRELRSMLNKAYGDSAFKLAKAIVESARSNNGNPLKIEIRRLFIVSEGEAGRLGNRNVRLDDSSTVRIRYPYERSWLSFRARFGENHVPLVKELSELAKSRKCSYGAKIVFRKGRVYLHLSVPVELYLKYFGRGEAIGSLIAGFDLNSDRVNMVIVDKYGRVVDVRTAWFPEVTSPGYPGSKAMVVRLRALAELLNYAYHHGVGVVVFEDLDKIKQRRFTSSPTANRKITRFAKKQLLTHAVVMALKYGLKPVLVDPRGTTSSPVHSTVMKKHGLDRHTASAYLIALRYLQDEKTVNGHKAHKQYK